MARNWMVVYYENGHGLSIEWAENEGDAKLKAKRAVEQEKTSTVWVGKQTSTFTRSVNEQKVD